MHDRGTALDTAGHQLGRPSVLGLFRIRDIPSIRLAEMNRTVRDASVPGRPWDTQDNGEEDLSARHKNSEKMPVGKQEQFKKYLPFSEFIVREQNSYCLHKYSQCVLRDQTLLVGGLRTEKGDTSLP